MSAYFSAGVENVFTVLKARGDGRSSFPRGWQLEHGLIGPSEPVHNWFVRCVDEHLYGDHGRCQVADRLAVFAIVHWRGEMLAYINCQALVTIGGTPLVYMKRAWRGKKDELWPYVLPADEVTLLSYEP